VSHLASPEGPALPSTSTTPQPGATDRPVSMKSPAPAAEPRSFAEPAPRQAHQPSEQTPHRTFRLPNGKTFTVATDRVRAKPAVAPQASFMLGQNAIGLGLWGLLAPEGV